MPTLDFKGKSFIYTHHLSVPFRELLVDAKKSLPAAGSKPSLEDNLIIHGDNLHALKALLPIYAGKVDCIYIDPPYNTGHEGWCYNDNVRSPLMKEWLKKSANPVEKDDLERHEKWLCMMWPRLKLLHELLAEHGSIWITLDDNEAQRAKLILDEIFGEDNFLANAIWEKADSPRMDVDFFSARHDHLLVYAKNIAWVRFQRLKMEDGEAPEHYDREDETGRKYYTKPLRAMGGQGETREARENLFYEITAPDGTKIVPKLKDGTDGAWRWKKEKYKAEISRIEWVKGKKGWTPYFRIYADSGEGSPPETIFFNSEVGSNRTSKAEIREIFSGGVDFATPKPLGLLNKLLTISTDKHSIILDSFAGSATTGHAVLAANKKDGGKRKFILVECEDYAEKLTSERIRRVINGYKFEGTQREELMAESLTWTKLKKFGEILERAESFDLLDKQRFDRITKKVEDGVLVVTGEKEVTEKVEGLGGSFTFCTLGEEMGMDRLLAGNKLPSFDSLAKYVFYTATGRTLADVPKQKADGDGFIAETELYRVHLYYKPEKKWLASNEAALTEQLVEKMLAPNKEKKRLLVFAAAKFMSQKELTRLGVEFCQLPYAIHRILGD
ncbi:MAG: site-specific DNA-methyltransferase [Verrucomicrobia bacterium]|nr:site-specific DNA-methyltransferase [Verrucomicrobiota bacterium]